LNAKPNLTFTREIPASSLKMSAILIEALALSAVDPTPSYYVRIHLPVYTNVLLENPTFSTENSINFTSRQKY
jgi:hypothetical protein